MARDKHVKDSTTNDRRSRRKRGGKAAQEARAHVEEMSGDTSRRKSVYENPNAVYTGLTGMEQLAKQRAEKVEQIRAAVAQGATRWELMERFGYTSWSGVYNACRKNGITPPKH